MITKFMRCEKCGYITSHRISEVERKITFANRLDNPIL